MLIPPPVILDILKKHGISVKGVLHIGAHECEELSFYTSALGLRSDQIFWIDALEEKVKQAAGKGIPNVFQAVLDEKERHTLFKVSSFAQSSSLLDFKIHSQFYPSIVTTEERLVKTQRLDSFVGKEKIPIENLNIWNLDIQGAELLVLKGAGELVRMADLLYLEVNEAELYKGGCLVGELDSYLSTFGFQRVHTQMTREGWGDAVYIRLPPTHS